MAKRKKVGRLQKKQLDETLLAMKPELNRLMNTIMINQTLFGVNSVLGIENGKLSIYPTILNTDVKRKRKNK